MSRNGERLRRHVEADVSGQDGVDKGMEERVIEPVELEKSSSLCQRLSSVYKVSPFMHQARIE